MSCRVRVAGTGSYLPERVVTNADLEALVETSDEWIVKRTGIHTRRMKADHQATSDLATIAARRAIEAAGLTPDDVDLVVCATVTPDHVMPSTACLVQRNLELPKAGGFDVALACSGYVSAFQIGAQFIRTGQSRGCLVIGADSSSTIIDYQDRGTCVIFGDGAGACLLRPAADDEDSDLLDQDLQVQGENEVMVVPAGGSRQPASHETVDQRLHSLRMEGRATFRFAVKVFRRLVSEAVERAGIAMEDLALVVPHQVNLRIIRSALERLDIGLDRVMINLDKYGNTINASVPIALDEAVRTGRLKRGQLVSLVAFGAGLSWGSCLLRW